MDKTKAIELLPDSEVNILHETFLKAITSKDPASEIIEMYNLKSCFSTTPKLYKYLSIETESISKINSVLNNEFYLSDFRTFNDPFDCEALLLIPIFIIRPIKITLYQ